MTRDPAVDAWLLSLYHPQADVIAAVRELVRTADPAVHEGIKWNAGSFRARDWFATFQVMGPRGPGPVRLVLHRGAKATAETPRPPDPAGLLSWRGHDRALFTPADLATVQAHADDLQALVRAWLRTVDS
jgi:hypothetical protein